MISQLPPYGRQWVEDPPPAGLWVATGPRAWDVAAGRSFPVVVLPPNHNPREYRWPATLRAALIVETGPPDNQVLRVLVESLMTAGAPSVVAIRESRLATDSPCEFYEAVNDG